MCKKLEIGLRDKIFQGRECFLNFYLNEKCKKIKIIKKLLRTFSREKKKNNKLWWKTKNKLL